jgi:hypothetical protein
MILATYSSIPNIEARSDGESLINRSDVKLCSIKITFRPSASPLAMALGRNHKQIVEPMDQMEN